MLVKKNNVLPFLMWFLPLSFFAYQFILRLWPGLMMHQIMDQFLIDASKFGLVAAFYYYGYAGMQIPVALLLERFGAKWVVFSFAILCGLATLLFTYSTHWYWACFARFLVGAGSAAGFLCVSKVISEWFPEKQYTHMIGLSFSIGLMGAIYGGKPVSLLIEHHHWQQVALVLAVIALVIGLSALLILRPPFNKKSVPTSTDSFKMEHFKKLLSSPTLWLLAIANFFMVGVLEGFSDVWGVPYLMTAYSISKSQAAELISFVFFGMLFGGPLLAWLSKRCGHYAVIALSGLIIALAFSYILMTHTYHGWLLATLFFTIGLMCCYQVIVFAAGASLVERQCLGVTIAFLNCINMLGGSFFHTIIGKLMDIFWTGTINAEGIRQYNLVAFHNALTLIPVCAYLGTLLVCWAWYLNRRKVAV